MTEFSELRAELAQQHAENSRRLDSLHQSQQTLANQQLETGQQVQEIGRWLGGPDGVLVRLGQTQEQVKDLEKSYAECGARLKHVANSTAADGIAALTQAGARAVLANDSIPPNRVQVAREKTKQERLRLARRIATVVGLVLVGGAGGAGLLQLLTPAQASQPAASKAP